VNALPLELQARIQLQFGNNPPRTHPFPRPVESLFEDQVPIQLLNVNVVQQDQEQVDDNVYDDGEVHLPALPEVRVLILMVR
jgi:hypothetical protein